MRGHKFHQLANLYRCAALGCVVGWVSHAVPLLAESLERPAGQSATEFADAVQSWSPLAPTQATHLTSFIKAYPEEIGEVMVYPDQHIDIRLRSGTLLPFATTPPHDYTTRLKEPSLEEMLCDAYPAHADFEKWPENLDPGRYRRLEFFQEVYGHTEAEVTRNLTKVSFCGRRLSFNRKNGAAAALEAVGHELEEILQQDPSLRAYVTPLGGTFAWRKVDGTEQLSAHSFGIAIDMNPDLGGYWRWEKRSLENMTRRRAYPQAIIRAFERHGFIWGGKWYHFDLMHFEYRPEFWGQNPYAKGIYGAADTAQISEPKASQRNAPRPRDSKTEGEVMLALACDVFHDFTHESSAKTNFVFSPSLLHASLAGLFMLSEAPGKDALAKLLHVTPDTPAAPMPTERPPWREALSLWLPQGVSLPEEASAGLSHSPPWEMKTYASADANSAGQTAQAANRWAAPPTGTPPLTNASDWNAASGVALLQALEGHGEWAVDFDTAKTKPDAFTSLDGKTSSASFMHGVMAGGWAHFTDGLTVAALPLRQKNLDLVLLLPARGAASFQALEASLTPALLKKLTGALELRMLRLTLPRTAFSQTVRLHECLTRRLGDDWPGLQFPHSGSGRSPLRLGAVSQYVGWSIDEGAQAATNPTTAPAEGKTNSPDGPELVLDRPFVFLIMDLHTRWPILMGHVLQPSNEAEVTTSAANGP